MADFTTDCLGCGAKVKPRTLTLLGGVLEIWTHASDASIYCKGEAAPLIDPVPSTASPKEPF